MYDFVDQRVVTLDQGGRFLIWSMRSWLGAMREGQCPAAALGPAFLKWNLPEALPDFSMAMMLIARHALEPIGFAPLACQRIREGEAIMLSLFRSTRERSDEDVRATLGLVVEREVVASLQMAMEAVATQLDAAGLLPAAPTALAGGKA